MALIVIRTDGTEDRFERVQSSRGDWSAVSHDCSETDAGDLVVLRVVREDGPYDVTGRAEIARYRHGEWRDFDFRA
jgi:hypothetical protein